jgi:hypothetical protein
MMIRNWMAICLFSWTLSAWQETEPKQTPKESPKEGTPSAETKGPEKKVEKKGADKKGSVPRPKASSQPSEVSVPVAAMAATKAIDALDAAIRASAEGAAQPDPGAAAKLKELQDRLQTSGDPKAIVREAAEAVVKLYNPQSESGGQRPKPEPNEPRQNFDYAWIPVLVSLMSPLICVAGFWLGAKTVENNVRKSLREAGLL